MKVSDLRELLRNAVEYHMVDDNAEILVRDTAGADHGVGAFELRISATIDDAGRTRESSDVILEIE